MDSPLISVVVPVYNTDRYTGICIESIINQTYKNLEIILVDDGSTDRCPEICDLYAAKDSRVQVIHKTNGGLVAARKTGVQHASGDYVGYVDGDDWVGKGYFEAVKQAIVGNNPDVVVSNWKRAFFDQHIAMHNNVDVGTYSGEQLDDLKACMIAKGKFFRHGISTYVWNKVFKRTILYDCQMNVDDRLMVGEDACVSYAALLKSKKISVIDNADYHYRQHEASMLKRNGTYRLDMDKLAAMRRNLQEITQDYRILTEQAEAYVLISCIIRAGGLFPDGKGFVFGPSFLGKKVVVYSAGTFGQRLVTNLLEKNACDLVGWVDDDYWEYRRCCLDVDSVSTVAHIDFDYVLLATVDGELADDIRKQLIDIGVDSTKILSVEVPPCERNKLLDAYLKE